jgi:hypothetical protein
MAGSPTSGLGGVHRDRVRAGQRLCLAGPASPDLLRAMVKTFAAALMSAEADALCNAEYGQVSDERVNQRNGYRPRGWDTRAGTVDLAAPKLRQGGCFDAVRCPVAPVRPRGAGHRSQIPGLAAPLGA